MTLDHEISLDPSDWEALRLLGHRMLDDMLDHLASVRDRPVWQPLPAGLEDQFDQPLPTAPQDPEQVYESFVAHVLPYQLGNIHPRFWGWVIGTGTPMGMLAAMLAAGVNPNAWGGNQVAGHVELQVLRWLKQAIGFPAESSGLLVSGASMANLLALTVARDQRGGYDVRRRGLAASSKPMAVYASSEVHSSIVKAVEQVGLGTEALRRIPVSSDLTINLSALRQAVEHDRGEGIHPLCVVGSAGTVNSGAIDDLEALADLARENSLWFHIDGAFGALAALAPGLRHRLRGLELADSLAFDLHKWLYIPYDVGCLLVRDEAKHRGSFSLTPAYLARSTRGVSQSVFPASDYGPELSRSFRSLKVWISLRTFGFAALGALIQQNVDQAAFLAARIDQEPALQRMAPATLNIVCYRFAPAGHPEPLLDALNQEILVRLQEGGIAVPSQTVLDGRFCLRVAITNHRSRREDFDLLVRETIRLGDEILAGSQESR